MTYCSWDMARDGYNCYFSFWTVFCPFTPLTAQKMKISKAPRDVIILHKCTKNYDHIVYCSWDAARDISNYLSFWAIFSSFTPLTCPKNENCKKMKKKNTWGYHYLTHVNQKLWLDDVWFPRNGAWQTDRLMDRQTNRGGCPT